MKKIWLLEGARIVLYTKLLYWTKFSSRVSILFSIFEVLGVILTDTECGLVVLSIFSIQFWFMV
jgi:hypothetical protein